MAVTQSMRSYPRTKRFVVSAVYALAIVAGLGWSFGPRGLLVGLMIALLLVAWRHDNNVGLLVPLAVLLIITILVMFLIFYLLAVIHP
jgi:MFS family permease